LKGRTLGLVGFGNISALVCKMALAFQMKVIALDMHPKPEMQALLGFRYVDKLSEVLAEADIVSLHVPSTKNTKGMVNSSFLGQMKKDAVLINTSRGNLVNDSDLLSHLEANPDFWFGADVLNGEPSAKQADFDNSLAKHPRAYITHHCGASTKEAEAAIGVEATRVLKKFNQTKKVDNCVNLEALTAQVVNVPEQAA
jgi:D-3-phosphoglycerate dehydrogenase